MAMTYQTTDEVHARTDGGDILQEQERSNSANVISRTACLCAVGDDLIEPINELGIATATLD